MRITNHLYMLSGAAYGLIGNVYAIVSENKVILIDTGKDDVALSVILDSLKYHELDNYPITHVLITHMHNDHSGNAWYFSQQGAKILVSEEDASGLETGGLRVNETGFLPFHRCKVDRCVHDGEKLNINGVEITFLLMPGHTNGSMFFLFEVDGLSMVVTGDTVLPIPGLYDDGYELGLGWEGSYELDRKKYMATLEKALNIKAEVMLAGHGIPVMRNGSDIFRRTFFKARATLRDN